MAASALAEAPALAARSLAVGGGQSMHKVLAENALLLVPYASTGGDNPDPEDTCTLTQQTHPAGPGGAPVVTLTLQGGGHKLPSVRYPLPDTWLVRHHTGPVCRGAEGPDLVWDFLKAYRR